MVDYLYVDLESGNLKAAAKGSLGSTPGRWYPVVWVDTLGDTPDTRVMSTIEGIRSWMQSSKSQAVPSAAIIATPTDLTILDSDPVLAQWKQMLTSLKSGYHTDPAPFPYVQTVAMGTQVLQVAYDLTKQHSIIDEKLWVKIEHHPATPGTIQLPGGIACESCDADPSDKEGKPVQPATPEGEGGSPGGSGGGGSGGQPGPNGGGGAPDAPEPFPGPAGACEGEECSGGSGEPGADGNGENGDGDPSDGQSGGSWGIWYGGDE